MKSVVLILLGFLLWNLIAGAFIVFAPPLLGLPIALALSVLYLYRFVLPRTSNASPRRRWSTLRLRPLAGEPLVWTLVAVPVFLALSWSLGDLYTRLIPVPEESLNPFDVILDTPNGRLAITVFAIAVAPIIEEFVFRGLIQRELERRFGPLLGISGAAALFALIHFLPWIFPLHFVLGLIFGFVVYATRSIWAGVILHAVNNSIAMLGTLLQGDAESTPTLWEMGPTPDLWLTIVMLLLAIVVARWNAQRLFHSGRSTGRLGGASPRLRTV